MKTRKLKTERREETPKKVDFYPFFSYFTGSCPPGKKGEHLAILPRAKKKPLAAPCLTIASLAYSEQEG